MFVEDNEIKNIIDVVMIIRGRSKEYLPEVEELCLVTHILCQPGPCLLSMGRYVGK